ncbi:MAG: hypothetical protein JWM41_2844 [Gemmatimonadetes bacterium]|nr:hypothetical protein [Gemmatimonadota bacterium]
MFVPAAAAMVAITAGSARLSAQCFRDADTPPSCLRPSPTDKPAAVVDNAQHLHVFVKGTDNALWHRVRAGADATSPWGAWESLAGTLLSGPSASVRPDNTIDVFVRGASNHLAHRWLTGSAWSAWEDLGGNIDSDPTSVSWGANRVDVFARNAVDKSLGHNFWPTSTGRWSGWESLGGVLAGGPAAASWAPNRLDVFMAGGGSYMYTKAWLGTAWSEYAQVGCCIVGTPTAYASAGNSLYVSALGTDNRLFGQSYSNGGWSGWQFELSPWHAASSPALAYNSQRHTPELIAMIPGGILMRLAADAAGTWGFWQPLMSGQYLSNIAVTSNTDYATAMNGCPAGYSPTGQDLNEGAGGDYIFLCLQWGSDRFHAIYNLGIQVAGTDHDVRCPANYEVLNANDLNKGAGGASLYLCYSRDPHTGSALSNIGFRAATGFAQFVPAILGEDQLACTIGDNVRYGAAKAQQSNLNLKTTKGKYIIACMIRATN